MKKIIFSAILLCFGFAYSYAGTTVTVYGKGGVIISGGSTTMCPEQSPYSCGTITSLQQNPLQVGSIVEVTLTATAETMTMQIQELDTPPIQDGGKVNGSQIKFVEVKD